MSRAEHTPETGSPVSGFVVTTSAPSDPWPEASGWRGLRRWETPADADAMCGFALRAGFAYARVVPLAEAES